MSILSFIRSMFGGSQPVVAVQPVQRKPRTHKKRSASKATKQAHPWLDELSELPKRGAMSVKVPPYMEIARAQRLVSGRLYSVIGAGKYETHRDTKQRLIHVKLKG